MLTLADCGTLAARLHSCGRASAPPEAISRRCRQYPTDFEAHVACSTFATCDRFLPCFGDAVSGADPRRRAQRLGHYLEDIRAALAANDFEDARGLCNELAADPELDPESRARCAQVAARAVEVLLPRVRRLRDTAVAGAGGPAEPTGLEVCAELLRWAERDTGSVPNRESSAVEARTACDEAAVALAVAPVLDPALPLGLVPPLACDAALEQAQALRSAFGDELASRVRVACGEETVRRLLGGVTGCDHRLRRALGVMGLTPRPWTDESTKLFDRARARCGQD